MCFNFYLNGITIGTHLFDKNIENKKLQGKIH